MGYITEAQYRDLTDRENRRNSRILSIGDFADLSDRTLTFCVGISPWRDAYEHNHVFIADGLLNLHVYTVFDNGEIQTEFLKARETMYANGLRTGQRRGTASTDLEFALMMENLHQPLQFFPPGDKRGHVDRIGAYFGLVTWEGEVPSDLDSPSHTSSPTADPADSKA
ncbi:MAG TPA: hypothetical protein VF885_01495 [Arthrobacter sp.]